MDDRELFIRNTIKDACGLDVSETAAHRFLRYYELLSAKNEVMNLTRIVGFEDVVKKHFADSLAVVKFLPFSGRKKILDLGTGAGFPGIPLKIMFPDLELTLVDSVGKKVDFVEKTAEELGLSQVECVHGRAEDLARDPAYREQFDAAVSRAVANLSTLSEYCLPFVKTGGHFAAYKSGDSAEEIEQAGKALKLLGGGSANTFSYSLFDMRRVIVLVDKAKSTPARYPRKAGTPARKPL